MLRTDGRATPPPLPADDLESSAELDLLSSDDPIVVLDAKPENEPDMESIIAERVAARVEGVLLLERNELAEREEQLAAMKDRLSKQLAAVAKREAAVTARERALGDAPPARLDAARPLVRRRRRRLG